MSAGWVVLLDVEPWAAARTGEPSGERYVKGRRAWSEEEASKVAKWEARRIVRALDAAPGPDAGVGRDPDFPATWEVRSDPDGAEPAVVATARPVRVPFAAGGMGPLLHPALEVRA